MKSLNHFRLSGLYLIAISLLSSCAGSKLKKTSETLDGQLSQAFYKNQFTGFFVLDAEHGDTIYRYNSEKYFTPASNTKIFTLYTALKVLPDLLPSLKYHYRNDTLYFRGTGDPTLLHPYFKENKALEFLKNFETLSWDTSNFKEKAQGPGWSWDDYDSYYAAERSALPLYGNIAMALKQDGLWVRPAIFDWVPVTDQPEFYRAREGNQFYFPLQETDTLEIPFRTDHESVRDLLCHHLNRNVQRSAPGDLVYSHIVYGMPLEPVAKKMMQDSDNFLAEQLLIMSAGVISDTLDGSKARSYMLENSLKDLKHPPKWVDGSGLSRYNLFTPESMAHVLLKLYREHPMALLKTLFPAGGVSGTLKQFFKNGDQPYVYAKTGTLSNNYCLSGYLLTKSGKTLVFSFMNNHYMGGSNPVKAEMEKSLRWLYENY